MQFTGIENWDSKAITVFPNPVSSYVTIRFPDFQTNATVTVRNALGQTITKETEIRAIEKTIFLEGLSGIYFIEIEADFKPKQIFKIVKN